MEALATQLRRNEEALLHCAPGSPLPETLLAEEFEEVGPQGRVSGRAEVLHWLARVKEPGARWQLCDFQAREVAPGLALVRYRARRVGNSASNGSRRSSLWRLQAAGEWRMVFHQATALAEPLPPGAWD